jgi:predicted transglutaminase-like cysteine proteinase
MKNIFSVAAVCLCMTSAAIADNNQQDYLHTVLKLSPEQETVWSAYVEKQKEAAAASNALYESLTPQQKKTFNQVNATANNKSTGAPGKSGGTGG